MRRIRVHRCQYPTVCCSVFRTMLWNPKQLVDRSTFTNYKMMENYMTCFGTTVFILIIFVHERPLAIVHERPLAIVHERPLAIVHERPLAIVHECPLAIVHQRPLAIVHGDQHKQHLWTKLFSLSWKFCPHTRRQARVCHAYLAKGETQLFWQSYV